MNARHRVVVTGSRGIAAEILKECDARGYDTYIVGGEAEESKELAGALAHCLGYSVIDLRHEAQTELAFLQASAALGNITDVIGVVGGSGRSFGDGQIHTISRQAWDQTLELNLTTSFLTLREGIKHLMASGGSITLTSSVLGSSPSPLRFGTQAYAVSKGAINSLVQLSAATYVREKIRINAVAPSLVETNMSQRATNDPHISEYLAKKQPLTSGPLKPSELCNAYLYFLENSAVTGQILTVDGGWSSVTDGLD